MRAQDVLADMQQTDEAIPPAASHTSASPKAETPPPSPKATPSTATDTLTPRTALREAVDSALVEAEKLPRLATWFDKKAVKRFGKKQKRFVELNTLGAEIRSVRAQACMHLIADSLFAFMHVVSNAVCTPGVHALPAHIVIARHADPRVFGTPAWNHYLPKINMGT